MGGGGREGKRDGDSALAGLEHLLCAGGSSHIVVAAGSQDSWREQGKNRDRKRDVKYLVSLSGLCGRWYGISFNLMFVCFIHAAQKWKKNENWKVKICEKEKKHVPATIYINFLDVFNFIMKLSIHKIRFYS